MRPWDHWLSSSASADIDPICQVKKDSIFCFTSSSETASTVSVNNVKLNRSKKLLLFCQLQRTSLLPVYGLNCNNFNGMPSICVEYWINQPLKARQKINHETSRESIFFISALPERSQHMMVILLTANHFNFLTCHSLTVSSCNTLRYRANRIENNFTHTEDGGWWNTDEPTFPWATSSRWATDAALTSAAVAAAIDFAASRICSSKFRVSSACCHTSSDYIYTNNGYYSAG